MSTTRRQRRYAAKRVLYDRRTIGDGSAYNRSRCSYCCRSLKPSARAYALNLTRTDDGLWWVVEPDAPVLHDEKQLGDPHFRLPIGADCLKRHPEFLIGVETHGRF